MYQCTTCLKEFKSERALSGHRSSHNRFNPSYLVNRKKQVEPAVLDIVQLKECNYCGKQFTNGWQLGGHKVGCTRKYNREQLLLNAIKEQNSVIVTDVINVNTT